MNGLKIESFFIQKDPNGSCFVLVVSQILGRTVSDYQLFLCRVPGWEGCASKRVVLASAIDCLDDGPSERRAMVYERRVQISPTTLTTAIQNAFSSSTTKDSSKSHQSMSRVSLRCHPKHESGLLEVWPKLPRFSGGGDSGGLALDLKLCARQVGKILRRLTLFFPSSAFHSQQNNRRSIPGHRPLRSP